MDTKVSRTAGADGWKQVTWDAGVLGEVKRNNNSWIARTPDGEGSAGPQGDQEGLRQEALPPLIRWARSLRPRSARGLLPSTPASATSARSPLACR